MATYVNLVSSIQLLSVSIAIEEPLYCCDMFVYCVVIAIFNDITDTKSKALACQQQCPSDLLSRLWSSEHLQKKTRNVTSHSMDSVMTAVFTAFDYDIDYASNVCNVKE